MMQQDAAASTLDLLRQSLDPDASVRIQAETRLSQWSHQLGFMPSLLALVMEPAVDAGLRQSASIYLKNLVKRAWPADSTQPLPEPDKATLRQQLLPALASAPPSIGAQLAVVLHSVLDADFPERWPTFLEESVALMHNGQDANAVLAGLTGLQLVVKIYQWKSEEKRAPLKKIVKAAFPMTLQIGTNLLAQGPENAMAGLMLKTILKTYFGAIQYEMPRFLQEEAQMAAWGTLLVQTVAKEIPTAVLPEDPEERAKFPWWKAKKWAVYILNKLVSRYGNEKSGTFRGSPNKQFAKSFMEKFAPVILQTYLHAMDGVNAGQVWIPRKVAHNFLVFFTDCIKHKTMWAAMKPKLEPLMTQFAFQFLCFTDEDQELWEDDAIEYLQKKTDPLEDFQSPSYSALHLFSALVRDRPKQMFVPVLSFLNHILSAYQPTMPLARQKDGALAILGALAEPLMGKRSPVREQVPSILQQHVLPEFQSPFPFLVVRACDVIKTFADSDDFEFSENDAEAEQAWRACFQAIFQALHSGDLVVKVNAALALHSVVERTGVREMVVPQLPFIMETLLHLTNTIDMDMLTDVMERLVELFPEELIPFSVQLCTQLRETFLRIMQETQQATANADEDDWDVAGDKTMAAMGIVKTICTLVLSVPDEMATREQLLEQLEIALAPVIAYTLQNEVIDLYDEVFELVDSCTFQLKRITPTMWNLLPLMVSTLKKTGIDFIEEIFPSLDNFLSYGKEAFCTNAVLQDMVMELVQLILTHESLDTNDHIFAFKLIESLLLNCRGHVDKFVEPFLAVCMERMTKSAASSYVVHCLEVAINCLYYNPTLTVSILHQKHALGPFLHTWLDQHAKFSRVHDKKLSAAALLECITAMTGDPHLMESMREGASGMMKGLLVFLSSLPKAEEAREEMIKMYGSDDDDSDDEEDDGDGMEGEQEEDGEEEEEEEESEEETEASPDASGDVEDEEAEYLEYLQAKERGDVSDEDDDDDEDWSQEMSEELYFESPLDKVDVYIQFVDVMAHVGQLQPQLYAMLTAGLSAEEQAQANAVMEKANERRKVQAEASKSQAASA